MEKVTSLPPPAQAAREPIAPTTARSKSLRAKVLLGSLFILAALVNFGPSFSKACDKDHLQSPGHIDIEDSFPSRLYDEEWLRKNTKCPVQPAAIHPKIQWSLTSEEKKASIKKFSEAVQIPTESFDDNGEPNEDPRWAPFFKFQEWLKTTFPLANEKAKIEYINTLGILATFEGSDPSLKPLLLMSHYDVVPAPSSTFDRWTHPPFSGHVDDEFVWGRGASDDKTLVVAQWEAITHLLEKGFQPKRTLILSHGFDEEEVFARRGQGHIAPFLEERYGNDGLLMVIDEGFGTSDNWHDAPFALPATGEKGYLDIKITVGTAGGHSSVPPKHSGIGIMSQIVSGLEDNPFPVKLTPESPLLTALMCASEYGSLPNHWVKELKTEGPGSFPHMAQLVANTSLSDKALVGTTTAVDVINGGVKVNALPELVTALVNFRIDFAESIKSTQDHITRILEYVAKENNLALSAFDGKDGDKDLKGRYVKVEILGEALEPAPRTPTEGGVWELFAGTVKAALPGPDGKERIVSPYASTGNTDCKMYYNLSKNVYRFMGGPARSDGNAHTVDEKASIDGHFKILGWIHAIIQNADAYEGEY